MDVVTVRVLMSRCRLNVGSCCSAVQVLVINNDKKCKNAPFYEF